METLYENAKHDDLNMPATVSFSAENAEKIVELMKESEVKCIVKKDEKKTDITFGIDDIEKLNKILQPIGIERQLNNSAIQLHNIEKKENLIPVANAFSNLYDRKINGKNSRIESHNKHISVLSKSLKNHTAKSEALKDQKLMLVKTAMTFPFFKSPINALIKRNEKKIERLNNKIPKLEKQIKIHQTTIDKLSKSAEKYKVRKNACKHLSEVIKSFVISNKKDRNQNYLTALLSLNGDIQQINNERIKNCIDTIGKLETNFSELPLVKQQKVQERISNLIKTQNKLAERNKILQAAHPDISAMLAKLNDNSVTERIDKAETALDKTIAQNNTISLDSAISLTSVENSCAVSPTAAEIVQTEVRVINNVNDKDGDMIADSIDSTFDPKDVENSETQTDQEKQNTATDIREKQTESKETQEVLTESDDSFDEMLEKYKDQIPPLYDDHEPEPDDYIPQAAANVPSEHINKETDTRKYLVTENELESLKKTDLSFKVNRTREKEDGRISILINAKDKGKYEKIMGDLKNSNKNKAVRK